MNNEMLILAGIEVAKLWLDYATRAREMTPDQALVEWHRVQGRAVEARERWQVAGAA